MHVKWKDYCNLHLGYIAIYFVAGNLNIGYIILLFLQCMTLIYTVLSLYTAQTTQPLDLHYPTTLFIVL